MGEADNVWPAPSAQQGLLILGRMVMSGVSPEGQSLHLFSAPFLPQPSLMALTWVAATLGHPWLRPRRVLARADGGDDRAQVGRLWA